MAHHKVPYLADPDVIIRLARDEEEIRQSNQLVFRNYVKDGFWQDDEKQLRTNPFLHTPARTVFVVLEHGRLVGTMSIIADSALGLPSDGTQAALVDRLRRPGQRLAEVSALAMDRSATSHRKLILFLMSFGFQHCFYYSGLDRLVASCKPGHASFYETVLCFTKVSDLTYYDYSHASGYLVSLDLMQAHRLLAARHPADPATGDSLYRFLLCDPQPCHRFPSGAPLRRPRDGNWLELGGRKVA